MRIFAALLLALCVTAPVRAQTQTSKERLSDKAADNQRVDNCRVAPERRGAEPRPDCPAETEPRPVVTEDRRPSAPK